MPSSPLPALERSQDWLKELVVAARTLPGGETVENELKLVADQLNLATRYSNVCKCLEVESERLCSDSTHVPMTFPVPLPPRVRSLVERGLADSHVRFFDDLLHAVGWVEPQRLKGPTSDERERARGFVARLAFECAELGCDVLNGQGAPAPPNRVDDLIRLSHEHIRSEIKLVQDHDRFEQERVTLVLKALDTLNDRLQSPKSAHRDGAIRACVASARRSGVVRTVPSNYLCPIRHVPALPIYMCKHCTYLCTLYYITMQLLSVRCGMFCRPLHLFYERGIALHRLELSHKLTGHEDTACVLKRIFSITISIELVNELLALRERLNMLVLHLADAHRQLEVRLASSVDAGHWHGLRLDQSEGDVGLYLQPPAHIGQFIGGRVRLVGIGHNNESHPALLNVRLARVFIDLLQADLINMNVISSDYADRIVALLYARHESSILGIAEDVLRPIGLRLGVPFE